MEGQQQPAGWYPDPEQSQTQRYWDGQRWTDQRVPVQDSDPLLKTMLWAMSLATGVAGVLAWGAPVLAYFWPLGLGDASIAFAIATRGLRGPTPWYATIALIAGIVALLLGFAGYSEMEDVRGVWDQFG